MKRHMALVAAFFATGILWSNAALADGALAVGMPGGDPNNGFAYFAVVNETSADAQSKALEVCRRAKNPATGRACKVVETFRNQCASVAFNGDSKTPSTAAGWAITAESASANRRAMEKCEEMRRGRGHECYLFEQSHCDGTAQ